ncbi:MAG TPA: hypothetical protein VFG50_04005, partial [Rhodothermales bacterium]|nr:hypothetical protein [Rhodothermales bacterium]
EYFRQVRLVWGGHGIDWPHEQDLSKDTVYAESKELFVAPQSVSDLIQLVGRMTRGLVRQERKSFEKSSM